MTTPPDGYSSRNNMDNTETCNPLQNNHIYEYMVPVPYPWVYVNRFSFERRAADQLRH